MTFSEKLAETRKALGFTYSQLSVKLKGLDVFATKDVLCRWERGQREPDRNTKVNVLDGLRFLEIQNESESKRRRGKQKDGNEC